MDVVKLKPLLEDLIPEGIETYLTLTEEASNRNGLAHALEMSIFTPRLKDVGMRFATAEESGRTAMEPPPT